MSREILFRGKVADEPDEWVYGYLVDEKTIFQHGQHKESKCCGWGCFFVKPETIGQYTGLTDKNGTRIFEGDIVKVYSDCDGYYTKKQYLNGVILFDEVYFFEYEISFNHIRNCCEENIGNHRDNIEVIGNIYDNSELLKED